MFSHFIGFSHLWFPCANFTSYVESIPLLLRDVEFCLWINPLSGDSGVDPGGFTVLRKDAIVLCSFRGRDVLCVCLQHFNMPRLCALECPPSGVPMHGFPNSEMCPEKFKSWVTIARENPKSVADPSKKRLWQTSIHTNFRVYNIGVPMHGFSNPEMCPEKFKSWVTIARGNPKSVADHSKKRL